MKCNLWKIKDREEYLGDTTQLRELQRRRPSEFKIVGNTAVQVMNPNEEPLQAPAVLTAKKKTKKNIKEKIMKSTVPVKNTMVTNPKAKSKAIKATRISANKIAVPVLKDTEPSVVIVSQEETKPEEPMLMPAVVNSPKGVQNPIPFDTQFSDGSTPCMIGQPLSTENVEAKADENGIIPLVAPRCHSSESHTEKLIKNLRK